MSEAVKLTGLANMRVVELATGTCGPYVGKLFVDAGADVIKVEPADGDPMRGYASDPSYLEGREGDSAFFQFLNGGKRSVTGTAGDSNIRELIGSADLLIEDFQTDSDELAALNVDQLRRDYPQLVVLSLSAFGRTGPYAERVANEFTIQAESGASSQRGLKTQKPYFAGGRIAELVGASYASVVATATVRGAWRTGHGDLIDFSLTETFNIAATIYFDLMWSILGRLDIPGPFRSIETPSIEKAKDGWVGLNTNSRQQFNDFLVMIGREDWVGDAELASVWSRLNRLEEWNEAVSAWMADKTVNDVIEEASKLRIPVAPVGNGQNVLQHEQFLARGVFEKSPNGDFMQPRPPYRINGQHITESAKAPKLGEHNGQIEPRTVPEPTSPTPEQELPLKGVRILDAAAWWAGPGASQMFATLGADVIHLESAHRFDGARTVVVSPTGDQWWEKSHLFTGANFNKRDLTLELKTEKGMALFKELIKECDVLVENFSPRVFESFGLTWDEIKQINPSIVFVRMPAFGLDGPWRDKVGFAQTIEQMSGLAWLTGHKEDQPRVQRGTCDPLAGMHAAFAILVALQERDESGAGVCLECTMVEGALNAAAEQIIEYSAYGNLMERDGNRAPTAAPQGLYYCKLNDDQAPEDENFLALSVENDRQWQSLKEAMGMPAWANDSRYDTHAGRRENHDEIDEHIEAWTKQQNFDDVVETLLSHKIPAAKVLDARYAYQHPQFVARGFFEEVDHPVLGAHPITGMPFRLASRADKPWIYSHAPTLGQHNHEILSEILGLTAGEITALEDEQIIGDTPIGLK